MTSICDTEEGFQRLKKALLEIDQELDSALEADRENHIHSFHEKADNSAAELDLSFAPIQAMSPAKAWNMPAKQIIFNESAGRISASFLCLFPPGAPVLVPGEMIDSSLIHYINQVRKEGISVTGLIGENKNEIEVLD
jgi:arginine/lysine/ornithine decarboxylase